MSSSVSVLLLFCLMNKPLCRSFAVPVTRQSLFPLSAHKVFRRIIQFRYLLFQELRIDNNILQFLDGQPSDNDVAVILMRNKFANIRNVRTITQFDKIVISESVRLSAIPFSKAFFRPQKTQRTNVCTHFFFNTHEQVRQQ